MSDDVQAGGRDVREALGRAARSGSAPAIARRIEAWHDRSFGMTELGATSLEGQLLGGRFLVGQLVGVGGMARVFAASDGSTGRSVIVKVMNTSAPSAVARFDREADILAGLRHPNIVGYLGHGSTADGCLYLAMERVEGETLAARLRTTGPLPPNEAIAIGIAVGEALGSIHGAGVVHRDIKPSNIMVSPSGKVTLLDFGIALIGGSEATLTQTGVVVGTPGYLSPEQARGQAVDARADIFSLGCVLFACLAGQAPFRGGDMLAILAKIVLQPTPRVRGVRLDLHPEIDDVVARLMAKSADDRPRDAHELVQALKDARRLASEPVTSHTSTGISVAEARSCAVVVLTPLAPHDPNEVIRMAEESGGQLERLANGAYVVRWLDVGGATERAVLAARGAVRMAEELVGVSVALATVRGTPRSEEFIATAIDRATALASDVPLGPVTPGAVRVDRTTAALLHAYFSFRSVHGALEIVAERQPGDDVGRLLGVTSPCIGRERELALLDATLAQIAEDTTPRAVVVTGEPGVGKTRLLQEWLRTLRNRGGSPVWIGGAFPWGARAPHALVAQAVRRSMTIRDNDGLEVRRAKVRDRVLSASASTHATDVERISAFLCELIGAPWDGVGAPHLQAARRDPALMHDQVVRAFREYCAAEARNHPLVIVFDDAQWSDLASVGLIDTLLAVECQLPVMAVAFRRPSPPDAAANVWVHRRTCHVNLEPLSRRSSERLVRHALGDAVDAAAVERVVGRAKGNPFFLEELVRKVASGGDRDLPDSVLVLLEGRLAEIDEEGRRVLRAASAFGDVAWKGGVLEVLGDTRAASLEAALGRLEQVELLERRPSRRFFGQDELRFRHALLREAVYATFVESDRQLAHLAAARWLTRMGEMDEGLLGSHFELAGAAMEAARCYVRAAERALAVNEFDGARKLSNKSLTVAPEGPDAEAALLVVAEASRWLEDHGRALQAIDAVLRRAAPGSDSAHRALGLAALTQARQSDEALVVARIADGLAAVESALHTPPSGGVPSSAWELAWQLGAAAAVSGQFDVVLRIGSVLEPFRGKSPEDPVGQALASSFFGIHADTNLDIWEKVNHFERAASCYAECGDERNELLMRCNSAFARAVLGSFDEAETELREVLARAERASNGRIAFAALGGLSFVAFFHGRLVDADAFCKKGLALLTAGSDRRYEGAMRNHLARTYIARGDASAAVSEAEASIRITLPRSETSHAAQSLRAHGLLRLGRPLEALMPSARVVAALDANELRSTAYEIPMRLVHIDVLSSLGRDDEANTALAKAHGRLRWIAEKLPPHVRRTYLTNRTDHARLERLAEERGMVACVPPSPSAS